MKPKQIIALIVGIFALLTGLTIWQLTGGTVAIQIGGEGNSIEVHHESHLSTHSSK